MALGCWTFKKNPFSICLFSHLIIFSLSSTFFFFFFYQSILKINKNHNYPGTESPKLTKKTLLLCYHHHKNSLQIPLVVFNPPNYKNPVLIGRKRLGLLGLKSLTTTWEREREREREREKLNREKQIYILYIIKS